MAGLIYQVSWTRVLTLHTGHTTAAASTVVAAFFGGLCVGGFLGARFAPRLTRRQSLYGYVWLECFVGIVAIVLPLELTALEPVLAWSYRDGTPGLLFPAIRLLSCLILIFVPSVALGATFPLAAHWFVRDPGQIGRRGGELYAANASGAAIGALAAGFILLPLIGTWGTTLAGVTAGGLAVAGVLVLLQVAPATEAVGGKSVELEVAAAGAKRDAARKHHVAGSKRDVSSSPPSASGYTLASVAVAFSGFAGLMFEIAWTRVFAMIVGPTTYAFAATIAAVIVGLAVGSAVGSWGAGRVRRPALWLALALGATAIATTWAASLAGGFMPRLVAEQLGGSAAQPADILMVDTVLLAALLLPAALGFGAAFPLALSLAAGRGPAAGRVGTIYALNTLGAVAGSLAAGFLAIPFFGLQNTIAIVSGLLVMSALLVAVWGERSLRRRVSAVVPVLAAVVFIITRSPWDQQLLASGVYKYASQVAPELDLETGLKAGTLLYYREGAASTVSVKRLTGTVSLAIDGKVDASSVGDMLTQKALAHLPLLLHPNPRDVFIIGLGSGVTLASALVHPITRVDVAEISPEVVEASDYFADVNRDALDDPRTNLIVGDGRSHVRLSSRQYDVIISEPSNPWMAGVAALFTREFFVAARDRLAPGGIICQWAHTYDISSEDLRSIVATFVSVFPDGTLWMIGEGDLLLVASTVPLDAHLTRVENAWRKPGVAADLADVSAFEPFAFLSFFVGGPQELKRYAAGATIQIDDRMTLEFSGPRALSRSDTSNASTLRQLLDFQRAPATVRHALAGAQAAQWRDRGAMMVRTMNFVTAYADYAKALALDPTDAAALDGFVHAAIATDRQNDTLDLFASWVGKHPEVPGIKIAMSQLLATMGASDKAIEVAEQASQIEPVDPKALEQLASVLAGIGDAARLELVVQRLQQRGPERASSAYYAAAARFLRRQYTDAIGLAQEAIARDPSYAEAHNLLGAVFATVNDTHAARAAFADALRLNPRDASVYTNLGLLELSVGNRTKANSYFMEALSLDPRSAAARQGFVQTK